jgi:Asp-tRNA(Asn)/Glu-tRNA(Gln) amidotransferase A subunit family amidase
VAAAERLKDAGAEVEEVSVPLHRDSAWVGWIMLDWLLVVSGLLL